VSLLNVGCNEVQAAKTNSSFFIPSPLPCRHAMTPAQPSQAPAQILSTEESQIAELSQFLIDGFQLPEAGRSALTPDALRWRYFEPRGTWPGPRSLVVREGSQFTAHIGVIPTAFVQPGQPAFNVSAVHPVDWLSTKQGGMLGTLLMLKAFGRADVQYSLGSTASGQRILHGCGFTNVCEVPTYYRFFKPTKRAVWNFIHGKQGFPRSLAMFGLDMARSVLGQFGRPNTSNLTLRPVKEFTAEVETLFHSRTQDVICSSRSAGLLNYLLRHPGEKFEGWMLECAGKNIGFVLTNIIERDGLRQGKIADCFLVTDGFSRGPEIAVSSVLWCEAIHLLTEHLHRADCDLIRTACNAPLFQHALRANGFFPRGRASFFLRDTRNLLPKDKPFHLTLLEGDMSY